MRFAARWLLSLVLSAAVLGAAGRIPILTLTVDGNERLDSEAILKAAGLRTGMTVDPGEFEGICQKLMDTGFFRAVNYRYEQVGSNGKPGLAVTLEVIEAELLQTAVLDIPGADEAALWEWLGKRDGLIQKKIPASPEATRRYIQAIEGYLKTQGRTETIVAKMEAELASTETTLLFQPSVLPTVSQVRFEGNQSVPGETLERALSRVAIGEQFSLRGFRKMLKANVLPVYEEQGRLRATFPKVSTALTESGGVVVTTLVDEGSVFKLGRVELSGGDIPADELLQAGQFRRGAVANWRLVTEAIARMREVYTTRGYLGVAMKPSRTFREPEHMVDVKVQVTPGSVFVFGELRLKGLDKEATEYARSLWKLRPGEPMSEPYVSEYLKAFLQEDPRAPRVKTIHKQLEYRPHTNIVDVSLSFR